MGKGTKTSFEADQWRRSREIVGQTKRRELLLAARNDDRLKQFGEAIHPLSDYKGRGLILEYKNGHKELFIEAGASNHRDMLLSFYEQIGVSLPSDVLRNYQSDHAFPDSAAAASGGLVKMQLVHRSVNAAYGAMLEKFRKSRKGTLLDIGVATGTLLDAGKAVGAPLIGNDFHENMLTLAETLIGGGLALKSDRTLLTSLADESMADIIGDS